MNLVANIEQEVATNDQQTASKEQLQESSELRLSSNGLREKTQIICKHRVARNKNRVLGIMGQQHRGIS